MNTIDVAVAVTDAAAARASAALPRQLLPDFRKALQQSEVSADCL